MRLLVGGQLKEFSLAPDALVYHRVGDSRLPLRKGSWIGGELVDFRAEGRHDPDAGLPHQLRQSRRRSLFARSRCGRCTRRRRSSTPRSGRWRSASSATCASSSEASPSVWSAPRSSAPPDARTVPALRLRTLLVLRDSLFSYDIERNAAGAVVGATFFGRGWGHGVGMCQVGAYGMALAGATYEEILKKYYAGIELRTLY